MYRLLASETTGFGYTICDELWKRKSDAKDRAAELADEGLKITIEKERGRD